jgi:hypothetical protein
MFLRASGITALITGALALMATPAFAGKGGNSSTTSTPSIAIASVNGTTTAAATTTTSPAPKLGDHVTFATSAGSMAGWEYPMVAVSCYQDVNGDGFVDTNLIGPDVVFTWLDIPSADFTMGGYSSIWTLRGGGDATCRAELDAYGWKGGKETTRVLATTDHWTATG